jgi:branched-chain amino acid transport system permease protein
MVAAAKQLLSRLLPSLRGRAARQITLQAELVTGRGWERQVVLREAVSESDRLSFVLRSSLYLGMRANFDPTIGPARLIYAFEAVIIGGLGSLWGTLAGGVILGVAQTIGARIDPEWQILAGHIAFLIVLVVRPRGLFPRDRD